MKGGGFDPEDTLIWWRGDAYLKTEERFKRDMTRAQRLAIMEKQAFDVIYESTEMVDGTWRRAFEQDLALDQHDSTSRGRRKLLEEIDAQIGALAGLDGSKIIDMAIHKTSDPFEKVKFGVFVDPNIIPPEWRDQIDFFRVAEEREKAIATRLRAGKKGDRLAMLEVIREVQRTTEARALAQGKGGGRGAGRISGGRARGGGTGSPSQSAQTGDDAGMEVEDGTGGAVRRWQPRASQSIPGSAIPTGADDRQTGQEAGVAPGDGEGPATAPVRVPEASGVAESIDSEGALSSEGSGSPDGSLQ